MSHNLKEQLSNRILKQINPVRASFASKIAALNATDCYTPEQKAVFVAHEEYLYSAAVQMYAQYVQDVIDTALLAYPAAPVVAALNALKALVDAYAAVPAGSDASIEHQAIIDHVNHLADDLQSIEVPY